MQKQYQDLFCDLQSGKSLVFQGESDLDGNWLNCQLLNQDNQEVARVENGIASWPCDDPWTEDSWAEFDASQSSNGIDHTTQINRQWHNGSQSEKFYPIQMKYFSQIEGSILEIAAGPGGGFASTILKQNPNANVIFNDIGLWLLQEWQKLKDQTAVKVYFGKEHGEHVFPKEIWKNAAFAQFDFNQPPFKAGSIDCVSSLVGLSNVVNWKHSVGVIHKLLKPNGLLVMYDSEIAEECLRQLTPEKKEKIYNLHLNELKMEFDPKYYEADFRVKKLLAENGFEILEFSYGDLQENDGSNGDYIPKLFTEMGIKFAFQGFHLVARKI